jgi:hypothetical protein
MLSKTEMALVPAASLVGAAAIAQTTSLAQSAENRGLISSTDRVEPTSKQIEHSRGNECDAPGELDRDAPFQCETRNAS